MDEEQLVLDEDTARAVVREALANNLPIDASTIAPDDKLHELSGADSVRLLKVITELERRLGLEFDDQEVFRPHTFAGLVALVWARAKTACRHG